MRYCVVMGFRHVPILSSCKRQFCIANFLKFVFERVETIFGKRENPGLQLFFLSPQCFHRVSFSISVVKTCSCKLNPFPNKPWFLRVCCTSLLKTLRKGEIAHYE